MRQSIAGAWLYSIIMIFMVFMIAYVAVSLNYNRAYKTKTTIVNTIEEYQGINDMSVSKIRQTIVGNGHTTKNTCNGIFNSGAKVVGITNENGLVINPGNTLQSVCITKALFEGGSGKGHKYNDYYYKAVIFFNFDLPIFGRIFMFKVAGETNAIYYPLDSFDW